MTPEEIIEFFGLKELEEEGGFYVETYRAEGKIVESALLAGYTGQRRFGSAILYLLTAEAFSALHKLKSDEIFHFYLGDPVTMLQLHPDGSSEVVTLGGDIVSGERVQVLVPAGSWQGSLVKSGGKFALLGCTVVPGFEFDDFELGSREALLERYSGQGELILKLTR